MLGSLHPWKRILRGSLRAPAPVARRMAVCVRAPAALLLLVACSDGSSPLDQARSGTEVASIGVVPSRVRVLVGEEVKLQASAFDRSSSRIDDAPFTWRSSDPSAASVDGSGLVRGLAPRSVTIEAISAGVSGSAVIEVDLPDVDLGIAYISRRPRLEGPESLDASPDVGWPQPGSEVEWVGHVFNFGERPVPGASWSWSIDGLDVLAGTATFPLGETELRLPATWSGVPDVITLRIDGHRPDQPARDSLSVRSDALSVALYVSEETRAWMAEAGGPPRWERWVRAQVEDWNATLAAASTALAPSGVRDRLRLDVLETVPDESTGGFWGEADFRWIFWERNQDRRFVSSTGFPDAWRDQTIVLHELLHQRGLVDTYAYRLKDDHGHQVRILDPDGTRAAGSERMPYVFGKVLYAAEFADDVLMGSDYTRPTIVSDHSVYGLNLFAGRRTPFQRFPGGDLSNWFVQNGNPYRRHVPGRIDIQVLDASGAPLAHAGLDVFLDHGSRVYEKIYHEQPDFILETDAEGVATLPPEYGDGAPNALNAKSPVTVLRARADDRWGYQFLAVYHLNLAWIAGDEAHTRVPLTFDLR